MNEQELIQKIAAGDADSLKEIYNAYRQKVFSTAFHYVRQEEDAEEILQDVFLEIFRSSGKYIAQAASPGTWIYKITVNKSLDKLRYLRAKKRFAPLISLFGNETAIREPTADLRLETDNREDNRLLYKAIAKLPENQKTALILTQLESLTIKDAAVVMDTSSKAVESLTMRAKANLKKSLRLYFGTGEGNV